MASRKTGYVLTGFILGVIGFILSLAGFSTPYWMEPFDQNEGFKEIDNLGLWQYCLSGYTAWRPGKGQEDLDILGKRYTGCKWVFHREVEFIRGELCPWWFQLTQSLISLGLTGSLFIAIAAMVLLCMNMCNQYPTQREALAYFVLAIISSAAGYFCAAGVLVFGHFSDTPEWAVKNPAYFHLSWSYAFSTFSGAFNIFSGMFLMLAYMQVKSMMKATRPNYKPTLELATLTPTRKY